MIKRFTFLELHGIITSSTQEGLQNEFTKNRRFFKEVNLENGSNYKIAVLKKYQNPYYRKIPQDGLMIVYRMSMVFL